MNNKTSTRLKAISILKASAISWAAIEKLTGQVVDARIRRNTIDQVLGFAKYGISLNGPGKTYKRAKKVPMTKNADAAFISGNLSAIQFEHRVSLSKITDMIKAGEFEKAYDAYDVAYVTKEEHEVLDSSNAFLGLERYAAHRIYLH